MEAEAVLQAWNQLKLVDALKGKSSTASRRGKQPLGEHKGIVAHLLTLHRHRA